MPNPQTKQRYGLTRGFPQESISYPTWPSIIEKSARGAIGGEQACGGCPCMPPWWKIEVNCPPNHTLQGFNVLLAGTFILKRDLFQYQDSYFNGPPCTYYTWWRKIAANNPNTLEPVSGLEAFGIGNTTGVDNVFGESLANYWYLVYASDSANQQYHGWRLVAEVQPAFSNQVLTEYEYHLRSQVEGRGKFRCTEANLFRPWNGYQGRGFPGQVTIAMPESSWPDITLTPIYP